MLPYQDTMSFILTSFIVLCGCSASHSSVVVFDMFKVPMMKFPAREARFGPDISSRGLAGHLIYAEPNNNACRPINRPPTSVNGSAWIALIVRYSCNFDQKVFNAQQSGYDAVIVYNNGSEDLIDMNSDGRLDIEIPSVFVSQSSGRLLEQFHNRLNVTIVLYGSADSMTFMYFIILGCIGGFGILFGICIVFVNYMCHRAKKRMSLLSKRKLKKLPIHKFKTGDRFDTCAICLDEYAEGDKLRVLPCGHAFHCNCIDVWLTEKMNTCPLCKDVVGRRGQPREVAGTTEEQRPLLLQSDDEEVGIVGVLHRGVDVTAEVHNPPATSIAANRRTYGSTGERPHPLAPTPSPSSLPASVSQVHINDDFLPDETVVHFAPVGPPTDPLGAGVVVVQSADVARGADLADRHVV